MIQILLIYTIEKKKGEMVNVFKSRTDAEGKQNLSSSLPLKYARYSNKISNGGGALPNSSKLFYLF